jgi:hypothetical protein
MERWRLRASIVALAVILTAHFWLLTRKIHPVQTAEYAVDLRVTPQRRYGFMAGFHGAILVKAPNSGLGPVRKGFPSPGLEPVMLRELRSIPWKAALEAAFYLVLIGYLFLVAGRLRALWPGQKRGRLAGIAGSLLPGAIFFVLAASPLLLGGYGYGGFSNLAGPGAISASGPYFNLNLWLSNSGNTISYRAFVSPIMIPAGVLSEIFQFLIKQIPIYGELIEDPPAPFVYWFFGAAFYGVLGAFAGWLTSAGSRSRKQRQSGIK